MAAHDLPAGRTRIGRPDSGRRAWPEPYRSLTLAWVSTYMWVATNTKCAGEMRAFGGGRTLSDTALVRATPREVQ